MKLYLGSSSTTFFNYTNTSVKFKSGINDGRYLKGIPRNVFVLGATYDFPFGAKASLVWNAMNDTYLDDENTTMLPHFSTLGLKVSYKFSHATFSLNIENLLDQDYSSTGYILNGTTYLFPAAGRNLNGGIAIEF